MNRFDNIINWEAWNRIVEQTKLDIAECLKKTPIHTKAFRIYSSDGDLVAVFDTQTKCAEFLNATKTTVSNYLKRQWNYKNYLLSDEELTKDVAFALYKYNQEHSYYYVQGETKKKIPIYSYNEDGKLVGAFETQYQWSKVTKKANSLIAKCDRIINDRLVSRNRYDEETARLKYKETLEKEPNLLSVYIYDEDGNTIKEKAPTRYIRKLTNCSYSRIYKNFSLSSSFYLNGYVISKYKLKPLEAKEIAKKYKNIL